MGARLPVQCSDTNPIACYLIVLSLVQCTLHWIKALLNDSMYIRAVDNISICELTSLVSFHFSFVINH